MIQAKKYFISDLFGEELGIRGAQFRYGNAVLSKTNFEELILRDFRSNQGTELMLVYFNLSQRERRYAEPLCFQMGSDLCLAPFI